MPFKKHSSSISLAFFMTDVPFIFVFLIISSFYLRHSLRFGQRSFSCRWPLLTDWGWRPFFLAAAPKGRYPVKHGGNFQMSVLLYIYPSVYSSLVTIKALHQHSQASNHSSRPQISPPIPRIGPPDLQSALPRPPCLKFALQTSKLLSKLKFCPPALKYAFRDVKQSPMAWNVPPQDNWKFSPCVLQDIGALGPLLCSPLFSLDHSEQGIGYRWTSTILGWLVFIRSSVFRSCPLVRPCEGFPSSPFSEPLPLRQIRSRGNGCR